MRNVLESWFLYISGSRFITIKVGGMQLLSHCAIWFGIFFTLCWQWFNILLVSVTDFRHCGSAELFYCLFLSVPMLLLRGMYICLQVHSVIYPFMRPLCWAQSLEYSALWIFESWSAGNSLLFPLSLGSHKHVPKPSKQMCWCSKTWPCSILLGVEPCSFKIQA